ncbi:DUF4097 domain-containing protein [Staphylococcus pseudoxylosus]|uniref:DUF4097 family beta strand repeat-containing protein n=1 Tax=Staphylococcus pseudoxylosus TaxID=2282419 RepID=UPI000D1D1EBB|nr:DUF4097 family beta strand repeat-containing protein [Staphylococcus pseudoxylosus]PTI45788.1 hypothetical protein BU120_03785 [Staphylococcus xylosus]MDW8798028.1 DUF4097 family beta strand repeat-containing protein [Staphylococcus pseudoxylosus]MEB6036681.1 DUF4097 domain-containing protein [Staphylococcus pseudoxylosus]MEB6043829.1 DUF4097 domain-containing protein [Staphylococcus pseudoxylosus]MEB6060747.1 DUF4097 domain-containing protein [Staphylococcus pseudoxylosus]
MRKVLVFIFIIGLIITVVCALGAIKQFKIEQEKAKDVTTNFNKSYEESDIKALKVNFEHSNLKVKHGDKFKVTSEGSNEQTKINAQISKGELKLTDNKQTSNINLSFLEIKKNDVVVTVPKRLEGMKLDLSNGSIDLNNIEAEEANVYSDVGELTINNSKYNKLKASSDVASILLEKTMYNQGEFETDTGQLTIEDMPIDKPTNIDTDTGDIVLDYGKLQPKNTIIDFSSDIGNLNIENSKLKNKKIGNGENLIKIITDTGDVTIK